MSVRSSATHPGASVRDIRSELFAAGPEMAGRTLPAMANLFDADGTVSPARAAAPAEYARQRVDPVTAVALLGTASGARAQRNRNPTLAGAPLPCYTG